MSIENKERQQTVRGEEEGDEGRGGERMERGGGRGARGNERGGEE